MNRVTSLRVASRTAWTLAFGLAVGCGEPQSNLLIVTLDTTRHDRIGAYGDPEAQTPAVDSLAERGMLFERSYSSVALTLPAHTTVMTGLEPLEHGVHNNGKFRVPDELDTLAERLARAGYATGAFVSAYVLDRRYNLDQGFDVYSDDVERDTNPLDMSVPQRAGKEVVDDLVAFLDSLDETKPEAPFFAWAHFYDPHYPRNVEPPFDAIADPYRAEIAYADHQLGRLLASLEARGLADDTIVVVTADHGESFGEHGEATHGLLGYDATLRVPLIIAGPGVPTGLRSDSVAYHRDIVPTVLALLGLQSTPELSGVDLLGLPVGPVEAGAEDQDQDLEIDPSRLGYFEAHSPQIDLGWKRIEGVRSARWKYTELPSPEELYDVVADPNELANLAAERDDVVAELKRLRAQLLESVAAGESHSALIASMSPEESAQLAALGYVEAAVDFEPGSAPDPRRFVGVHGWVSDARDLAMGGRFDQAIEALETLRESPSVRALVLRTLAPIYKSSGRFQDAVDAYREYGDLTGSAEARLGMAEAWLELGRAEAALAALDEADLHVGHAGMLRARALALLGRDESARTAIERAFEGRTGADLEVARARARLVVSMTKSPGGEAELRSLRASYPEDLLIKSSLGFLLAVRGDADVKEEAIELLRGAAVESPEDAEIQANLGWGAYRVGVPEEAIRHLELALALDKGRSLDRARLAHLLFETGQEDRAREEADHVLRYEPGAPWAAEMRGLRERSAAAGSGGPAASATAAAR